MKFHAPDTAGFADRQDPRAKFALQQARLLDHYGVHATSRYVQLARPSVRLHLLEAGAGEPVVIFHGGDGQAVDWAPLLAHLQARLRLYAVDRPGFGLSDPFDYGTVDLRRHVVELTDSLLDALGLQSAHLVGGSMGGFFALAYALARPQRVRRLVLVGMPVGLSAAAPLGLRIACSIPGATRLMMRRLAGRSAEPRRRQYRRMFRADPARIPGIYFRMQAAGLAIPGAARTWAILLRRLVGLRGMRREVTLTDELPQLAVPALMLWGERDMTPAAVGRAAAAALPAGRFVVVDEAGHFPFLDRPRRCAELIEAFLGTSDGTCNGRAAA